MIQKNRITLCALALGAIAHAAAVAAVPPRYSLRETTTAEKIPLIMLRDETSRLEAAVGPRQADDDHIKQGSQK